MPEGKTHFFSKYKFYIIGGIVVVGVSGFFIHKKYFTPAPAVRYVTSIAEQGTLVLSVSGSGQVATSNQVDLKPQVSGKLIKFNVKNGQIVKAGDIVAQIDATDAYKTVRDAKLNVESALLSLSKLNQKADSLSMLQAQNSIASAQDALEKLKLTQANNYQNDLDTKQKAQDNITKAYEDAFNAIDKAFLELPDVISGLNDVLFNTTISDNQITVGARGQTNGSVFVNTSGMYSDKVQVLEVDAEDAYRAARQKYDKNFSNYKSLSRSSTDQTALNSLFNETVDTIKAMTEAGKKENNLLSAWVDYRAQQKFPVFSEVKNYQSDVTGYIGTTNGHLTSLLAIQTSLKDNQNALSNASRDLVQMAQNNPRDIAAAEASIKEKQASLVKLQAPPDTYDIQSSQLSLRERQAALSDAQAKLADYTVKASFDGVVTGVTVKTADSVSSATILATILTQQKIATISLNEVDVAKVKVGQKVTLTFDAVEGLSLTGAVAEIDALGTVSQGVVSYNVKISFDSQDDRIKSGMSVSATIINTVKQNVLLVPSVAIKSGNGSSYVQVLVNGQPENRSIEVGLNDDTNTEITGGELVAGEAVITQTIAATTNTTASTGLNGLSGLTGGGANRAGAGFTGGGNFRVGGTTGR